MAAGGSIEANFGAKGFLYELKESDKSTRADLENQLKSLNEKKKDVPSQQAEMPDSGIDNDDEAQMGEEQVLSPTDIRIYHV